MWGSVAVLALPIALDPVRLGVSLLLVSRPRPAQNLLAYWVGCVLASVVLLIVPILVLHSTPSLSSFIADLANPHTAASTTVRHAEVCVGALVLSIAALLAVRVATRTRATVPAGDIHAPSSPAGPDRSNPIARLLHRGDENQDSGPTSGSAGRLLSHARRAWESGALWGAFVIGFWAGPNPSLVVFALTTILTSGASVGMQVSAAWVFIVETLAIVEIVLFSNVVTPTRTQALLRILHDWVRARRGQILAVMFALIGLALVAQGVGAL